MKVIHLINETYQVIDEFNDSILFQGNLTECMSFIQLYEFRDNPFLKEFLNLINPKL